MNTVVFSDMGDEIGSVRGTRSALKAEAPLTTIWADPENEEQNVEYGHKLCECIEEFLAATPGDGSIDWKVVSGSMVRKAGSNSWTPKHCKRLWDGIAYGYSMDQVKGSGEEEVVNSDDEQPYLHPFQAVRRFHLPADVDMQGADGPVYLKEDGSKVNPRPRKLRRIIYSVSDSHNGVKLFVGHPEDQIVAPLRPTTATRVVSSKLVKSTKHLPATVPGLTASVAFANPRTAKGPLHSKQQSKR